MSLDRENLLSQTLSKNKQYLPKLSVKVILALASIAMVDTLTTHIGVIQMGYTEFNLAARYFIEVLGSNWWLFNLFYESILLIIIFYSIRFMRTKYTRMKFRSELLLFAVATALLINNTYFLGMGLVV